MSYLPNIERSYRSMQKLADEMEAWSEEQQKLADSRRDEVNRLQSAIKAVRMDHAMVMAVLEALAFAAMRDKVLCEADLSMLDEAQSFIGGVA